MRLLHTSDWHLGRSFHGSSTLSHLREVLGAIPGIVREHGVDTVLVAGDVFDHSAPAAELYGVLAEAIRGIREAGAVVVMTSGNHDNPARLGFQSEWASLGGVHVVTRPEGFREPIELFDEHGAVDVYPIPYLEPMQHTGLYRGETLRTHAELLPRVMTEVRELAAARGSRSIVLAHCFAANFGRGEAAVADAGARPDPSEVAAANTGLVWDLTAGGVDVVPASVFDGIDYVALGHIHGRMILTERVRYSGAPLHFSFSEAGKPRGGWIVDLSAEGLAHAEWVDLPVPRPLVRVRGTLDELLTAESYSEHVGSWVQATLTDRVRPVDAMRRLRERFPYCAHLEFEPEGNVPEATSQSYASKVERKNDLEIVDEFLNHVRNGVGLDSNEQTIVREVIAEVRSSGTEHAETVTPPTLLNASVKGGRS